MVVTSQLHVGLGAAKCLHTLWDPSSVPSSFDNMWRCPRSISTIMCIHEPTCEPPDCSGHGDCVQGECRCNGDFWRGPACDTLDCGPSNCSLHGTCTACESPWHSGGGTQGVALRGMGLNRSPGQSSHARCSTGVTSRVPSHRGLKGCS